MDTNTEMVAQKKDRGFTLVELLIVIVILGILATVTVFAVRGITTKAQTNSCKTERRAIETAMEAFFADTQGDVTGLGDLTPNYMRTAPNPARWDIDTSTPPKLVAVAGGDCVGQ
jgi:prepilin-type N-terminal cleavage/methylation domain-containing protein